MAEMLKEKRRARLAFRCYPELYDQIKAVAAYYATTMSFVIETILTQKLLQPSSAENVRHDPTCDHLDPTSDPLAKILDLLAQIEDKEN